jgi:heme-degrading monooxygenase HmoA
MYARSALLVASPETIDGLLNMLETEMGPKYTELSGFMGFTVIADRERYQVFGISFWRTEEDRDGAAEWGRRLRRKANEIVGGEGAPVWQQWEVPYFDVPGRRHKR